MGKTMTMTLLMWIISSLLRFVLHDVYNFYNYIDYKI